MQLISDYMRDEKYRHMLNELTAKTFGFDFENWVTQGYFEGDYIPYSFIEEGKMVSNVSANRMEFIQNGKLKHYIQIGTVMTDEAYRRQGLAMKLIRHVIDRYSSGCDGIYLFGNLNALGFYRRAGFKTMNQYRYFVKSEYASIEKKDTLFRPIKGCGEELRKIYLQSVRECASQSSFDQINRYGLQMFYTSELDNVYYAEDIGCFAVIDKDEDLVISSVICKEKLPLSDIICRTETDGLRIRLGYTPQPEDMDICVSEEYDGADDYRLFIMGDELRSVENEKLYFPDMSHA